MMNGTTDWLHVEKHSQILAIWCLGFLEQLIRADSRLDGVPETVVIPQSVLQHMIECREAALSMFGQWLANFGFDEIDYETTRNSSK